MRARVFPTLLLLDDGLVKTVQFQRPRYIGDPINAVRIFNEKQVDELVFLDIMATRRNNPPPIRFISQISDECFMPLTVGGGIRTLDDIQALLQGGAEKVAINTAAFANPALVEKASETFGSQSIVVALDVKRFKNGRYEVFTQGGTRPTGIDPVGAAVAMASRGAGELLVTSIDRDGTMAGYDIELVRTVSDAVRIPVIACGGAGKPEDLLAAADNGHASAVTAGSLFVFHGPRRAVLINFPTRQELESLFDSRPPGTADKSPGQPDGET